MLILDIIRTWVAALRRFDSSSSANRHCPHSVYLHPARQQRNALLTKWWSPRLRSGSHHTYLGPVVNVDISELIVRTELGLRAVRWTLGAITGRITSGAGQGDDTARLVRFALSLAQQSQVFLAIIEWQRCDSVGALDASHRSRRAQFDPRFCGKGKAKTNWVSIRYTVQDT